jgi:hypothetical protein
MLSVFALFLIAVLTCSHQDVEGNYKKSSVFDRLDSGYTMACEAVVRLFGWSLTEVVGVDDAPVYQQSTNERKSNGKATPQPAHFATFIPHTQALLRALSPLVELCSSDTALQSSLDQCKEHVTLVSCVNARVVLARRDDNKVVVLSSPGVHIANITFSSFFTESRELMAQQYEAVLKSSANLLGLDFTIKDGGLQGLAKLTRYQKSTAWNWPVCDPSVGVHLCCFIHR